MKKTPDWFGNTSPYEPRYELTIEDGFLRFHYRVEKRATCNESLQRGEFVEGLWEQDVAEFFVANGRDNSYQEVNISPTGAWWSALFSDYRKLERTVVFEPIIETSVSDSFWEVQFKTEIANLCPWQSGGQRLFSAASILYDPEANYFCWNHQPGTDEPDFHRRDLFHPLH